MLCPVVVATTRRFAVLYFAALVAFWCLLKQFAAPSLLQQLSDTATDSLQQEETCRITVRSAAYASYASTADLRHRGTNERIRISGAKSTPLINLDPVLLRYSVERITACDPAFTPAHNALLATAERMLQTLTETVTNKTSKVRALVPGSNPRHYVSVGFYHWPCNDAAFHPPSECNMSTGLPWVKRDGHASPHNADFDLPKLSTLCRTVPTLAYAYHFSGDSRYSAHAALMLRTFFTDDVTGMLPDLQYAQVVPGKRPYKSEQGNSSTDEIKGRSLGIISFSTCIPTLLDSVTLLKLPPALVLSPRSSNTSSLDPADAASGWSEQDDASFRLWVSEYTEWLLTHPQAKKESNAANNHGTWFAVQLQALGLWLGSTCVVRRVRTGGTTGGLVGRLQRQVRPDGVLPHEVVRPASIHYTLYGLMPFFLNAHMAAMEVVSSDSDVLVPALDLWAVTPTPTPTHSAAHNSTPAADIEGSSADVVGPKEDSIPSKPLLRAALDFVAAYAALGHTWPYPNVGGITWADHRAFTLLRRGAVAYHNATYLDLAARMVTGDPTKGINQLLWPPVSLGD